MAREPELVNRIGTLHEKVPKFMIKDENGEWKVHPAFIRGDKEIDCFYVQQPVMLSFCRLRSVTRINYREADPTLFRDFESERSLITRDEMLAYSTYMEDDDILIVGEEE